MHSCFIYYYTLQIVTIVGLLSSDVVESFVSLHHKQQLVQVKRQQSRTKPILQNGLHLVSLVQLSSSNHRRKRQHEQQQFTLQLKRTTTVEESNDDNSDVATIQILISDTGGGHRASANAISDALNVLYPGGRIQCDIVDIYTDYGPFWPYNDYVNLYKIMAKYPWTWDLFYKFGSTPIGLAINEFLLETFCFEPFTQCLFRPQHATGTRADMVISVHPLTQDIPLKILAYLDSKGQSRDYSARTKTPFVTVVTDLGSAHLTWFNRNVDVCFVPSDALYEAAQNRGLNTKQIRQYGLPIRKGFWQQQQSSSTEMLLNPKEKQKLRATLGIQSDLPTVLVVGGGDGMGGLVDISKQLGIQLGTNTGTGSSKAHEPKYQMIVVCGNNADAKNTLSQNTWPSSVNVVVQGFVNNMDQWMKASDVLVTKAGPGTIAEASICGLPCMLFSYLPGQEEGNIPFVEDSGFGKYSSNPVEIAETVNTWLRSPTELQSLQQSAVAASRPQATLDIAKDIAEILFQSKQQRKQTTTATANQLVSTATK